VVITEQVPKIEVNIGIFVEGYNIEIVSERPKTANNRLCCESHAAKIQLGKVIIENNDIESCQFLWNSSPVRLNFLTLKQFSSFFKQGRKRCP